MSKTALQTVQNSQMSMGNRTDEWTELIYDNIGFKGPVAGKQQGEVY